MANLPWPSDISYGRIIGQFAYMDGDSYDIDTTPDMVPAMGTVTITPSVNQVKYNGVEGPKILVPRKILGNLDANGYLVGPDGKQGIVVPSTSNSVLNPSGWTYAVSINITDGGTINLDISLDPGEEKDITTSISIPASGGTVRIIDESTALRAEAAASSVFNIVSEIRDDIEAINTATLANGYRIFGIGRPDIASTMDADIASKVSSAPIGCEFISTNGHQGAWRWQKTTAGWTVLLGDTGWRQIASALANANMSVSAWIRRVNNRVTHYVEIQTLTTNRAYVGVIIPSGYRLARPDGANHYGDFGNGELVGAEAFYYTGEGTSQARGHVQVFQEEQLIVGSYGSPLSTFPAILEYATTTSWPTTLPGTAA